MLCETFEPQKRLFCQFSQFQKIVFKLKVKMASFGELSFLSEISNIHKSNKKHEIQSAGTVALDNGVESPYYICVQVENQGIEVYHMKDERLFASCPLPEKTRFSCSPIYIKEGNWHYIWTCTSLKTNGEWKILLWKFNDLEEESEVVYRDISNQQIFALHFISSTGQLVIVFRNGKIAFLDPEDDKVHMSASVNESATLLQSMYVPSQANPIDAVRLAPNEASGTNNNPKEIEMNSDTTSSVPKSGSTSFSANVTSSTSMVYLLYSVHVDKIIQYYVDSFSVSERRLVNTRAVVLKEVQAPSHILMSKDSTSIYTISLEGLSIYSLHDESKSYMLIKILHFQSISKIEHIELISDNFLLIQHDSQLSLWDITFGTIQDVYDLKQKPTILTFTCYKSSLKKMNQNSQLTGYIAVLLKKGLAIVPYTLPIKMLLADAVGKRTSKIGKLRGTNELIGEGVLTKSKNGPSMRDQLLKNIQLQDHSLRDELISLRSLAEQKNTTEFDAKFLGVVERYQNQYANNCKILKTSSVLPIPFAHAIESLLFSLDEENELQVSCAASGTLNYLIRHRLFSYSTLVQKGFSGSVFDCLYKFQKDIAFNFLERTSDISAYEIACAIKTAINSSKVKLLRSALARLSLFDSTTSREALLLALVPEDFDSLFKTLGNLVVDSNLASVKFNLETYIYCLSVVLDAMGVGGVASSSENLEAARILYNDLQEKLTNLTAMSLVLPAISEIVKRKKDVHAERVQFYANPQPKAIVDDMGDLATLLKKDFLSEKRKGKSQRARGKEIDMAIGKYTVERLEI